MAPIPMNLENLRRGRFVLRRISADKPRESFIKNDCRRFTYYPDVSKLSFSFVFVKPKRTDLRRSIDIHLCKTTAPFGRTSGPTFRYRGHLRLICCAPLHFQDLGAQTNTSPWWSAASFPPWARYRIRAQRVTATHQDLVDVQLVRYDRRAGRRVHRRGRHHFLQLLVLERLAVVPQRGFHALAADRARPVGVQRPERAQQLGRRRRLIPANTHADVRPMSSRCERSVRVEGDTRTRRARRSASQPVAQIDLLHRGGSVLKIIKNTKPRLLSMDLHSKLKC